MSPACAAPAILLSFLFRHTKVKDTAMGQRRKRREMRQHDQAQSRLRNGKLKVKERIRRDQRMLELAKRGHPPYAPSVLSWLSVKLNKPGIRITAEDVKKLAQPTSEPQAPRGVREPRG
jgi:hypothetical protein